MDWPTKECVFHFLISGLWWSVNYDRIRSPFFCRCCLTISNANNTTAPSSPPPPSLIPFGHPLPSAFCAVLFGYKSSIKRNNNVHCRERELTDAEKAGKKQKKREKKLKDKRCGGAPHTSGRNSRRWTPTHHQRAKYKIPRNPKTASRDRQVPPFASPLPPPPLLMCGLLSSHEPFSSIPLECFYREAHSLVYHNIMIYTRKSPAVTNLRPPRRCESPPAAAWHTAARPRHASLVKYLQQIHSHIQYPPRITIMRRMEEYRLALYCGNSA